MPPHNHNHNNQNSDTFLSDLSLTDSNRFGSASSSLFDPTHDCSSLNGRTIIAVRHLQRQRSSLTSRCSSSRRNRSFDSYDAEHLRRSLHSDEVISTLTPPPPPPPPPRRSPNIQSKATKEKIERYKKLYDATLQDVLSVLKANDDPSSADIILPSDPSAQAIVAACSNKEDSNEEETLVRLTLTEPPAIKRGLDAPPSPPVKKSDDFLSHAHVIIARQQQSSQQRSLSDDDSTVVIDCENESHDIMSLLSDNSNDGIISEDDVLLLPLAKNKMRRSSAITITSKNNFRQPRKEDNAKNKKRRSKSVGGDQRRRQKIPASSATTLKPKKRPDGKKQQRPESMQRRQRRQRQSSRSKSPFARSTARGRSATPVTDVGGAAIAGSRSNKTHPLRHDQSSSTGLQNSSGAFMSLNRSSTDRRRSSSSSREGPRRRPSIAGSSSSNANCYTTAKNGRSDEKKKAKLMTKMKLFASEMKHRLDESKKILSSGSSASSHTFKGGDVAEYRVGSSRVCLDDLDDYFIGNDGYTKMCAVRILEVGEDAVYEKPLYTILLPNGSKRQTNGNFLSPCCSKQVASESYRSRHQSALKLKSRNRSSSGSSSKRHSRSQSLESNSSRHSHSNRSSRAPSRSSPQNQKHCARSRSSESNSSRHSNRSISSHRSSSKHYSRRSCSPHEHKSKTRLNDNHHRNGSNDNNDRSTPRSKQHKHPSLPNAKCSNGTSITRPNSSNCPKSPSYTDTDPIIDSTLTLADNMKTSTSIVAENPMNKTQRW